MTPLILVTGGVKSGKSRFAMQWVLNQTSHAIFIATARRTDAEMSARIDHHIAERGEQWHCVEEPIELATALLQHPDKIVLVDCLGVWLTNLMVETPNRLEQQIGDLLLALQQRASATVFVSNESGLGVIGADAMTREFVDRLGLLNQAIAEHVNQVYFCVAGQPMLVKDTLAKDTLLQNKMGSETE